MEEKGQEKVQVKRYYEPPCPPTCGVFEWQVDEEGHHLFVKVGEKNLDDEIQLWKDSTDIKVLVDKITKDPSLITVMQEQANNMIYGDVNNYPQEVHVVGHAQALHQLYENQPDAIKEKFPTYEQFERYFVGLTAEAVEKMFAPKQEDKDKEGEKVNE